MKTEGSVSARHWETGAWVAAHWRDGILQTLTPTNPPQTPGAELWIAPALVDLQINGFAGVDFQQDALPAAALHQAAAALATHGCGRSFATLITDAWPSMVARLAHLRQLRDASPFLQHAIAGWHIEGPFLSGAPGFCGAHDPQFMIDPTPAHIRELRRTAGNDPVLLTLAPERSGALEAITLARNLNIHVSLGHTDASLARLRAAIGAGASGFTHLGNGCPQSLDRHDNILWRVFELDPFYVSLIPDRVHVVPALFRLAHRCLQRNRVFYTTDAMSAAGAAPGRYPLGPHVLEVGSDRIVRRPGQSNFSGSALCPLDGVWRAAEMLGEPWQSAWRSASVIPAEFMGLGNGLEVGRAPHFCLLELQGPTWSLRDIIGPIPIPQPHPGQV
jgi:N-acetylglucosamine-6-phosphate deacetylase